MDGAENWVLMSVPTFTAARAPTRNVNSSSRESLETDAGGPTEGARSRRTPLQEAQQTRSACDPQDKARRSARRLAGPMASDQWELRLPGDPALVSSAIGQKSQSEADGAVGCALSVSGFSLLPPGIDGP